MYIIYKYIYTMYSYIYGIRFNTYVDHTYMLYIQKLDIGRNNDDAYEVARGSSNSIEICAVLLSSMRIYNYIYEESNNKNKLCIYTGAYIYICTRFPGSLPQPPPPWYGPPPRAQEHIENVRKINVSELRCFTTPEKSMILMPPPPG